MGRTVMVWALEIGNERQSQLQPLPQMSAEQKPGFDGCFIGPLTHLCSEFDVVTP